MYRNVILEFLSANSQCFKNQYFNQMTLVLLDKKPLGLGLINDKDDEVLVYHIKNQFTYEKKYSINELENNIIEIVLEYQEKLVLNYDELSYAMNDPFYLKDIREQAFLKIEIIPVFNKKNIIGVALIYLDDLELETNISNQKWLTFFNKLIDSNDLLMNSKINNLILQQEDYYIVVKDLKTDIYYLNDSIAKDLKVNKIINKKDPSYRIINHFLLKMKMIKDKNINVYYLSKNVFDKTEKENIEFYLLDSINNHGFNDEMTLIFSQDLQGEKNANNLGELFIDAIKKIGLDVKYKIYHTKSDSIVILIDKMLSKKEENDLKFILKKLYYLCILMPKNLPLGVDLIKVTNYLVNVLPMDFSYEEYKKYQNSLNVEKYECIKASYNNEKIIIKANTLATIGEMISGPIPNYFNQATYKLYELETISTLEKAIREELNSPIFTVLATSIRRRKIIELLKKIIVKYPNCKIIIHLPVIFDITPQEVFELILKVKNMGFIIVVDSTIFMNLLYSNSIRISDAVIVRKNEMKESLSLNNVYNQKLFESYYDEGKVVIFEEIPQEKDASLVNELTCLIINR